MKLNYAIIFVSDMDRSVSFYRDIIGLPLKFESPGWTEFKTPGATLALHLSKVPNTDTGNTPESAGSCRPGFQVPDLNQFHHLMIEKGVSCVQQPCDVFGGRVAQYQDPDGLTISIGEER